MDRRDWLVVAGYVLLLALGLAWMFGGESASRAALPPPGPDPEPARPASFVDAPGAPAVRVPEEEAPRRAARAEPPPAPEPPEPPEPWTLFGRLVREDGGPAAYPLLWWPLDDAAPRAVEIEARRLTYSDAAGRFEIEGLPAGRPVLVRVPGPDEGVPSPSPEPLTSRAARFAPGEGATLALVPAVRVELASRLAPGPLYHYELVDAADVALRAARLDLRRPPAFALAPGEYTFVLFASGAPLARYPIDARGEAATLVLGASDSDPATAAD